MHDDGQEIAVTLTYFRRIRAALDPKPYLGEIAAHEAEWLRRTGRQNSAQPQRQTQAITLRGAPVALIPPRWRRVLGLSVERAQWSVWTPESRRFPHISRFLKQFAKEQNSQLGRAMIVRLAPNGRVDEHIDEGTYYERRDRYHFVLQSLGGSILNSGGESITMREGELWWFDNSQPHSALNPAGDWRIHVIFDMSPTRLKRESAVTGAAARR